MNFLHNGGQVDMDQNSINKTLFPSVFSLKKVLGDKNSLQIIHPDAIWTASFEWNNPIEKNQENIAENLFESVLPRDLFEFWKQISDGAVLYYDQRYGQWGYRIYSSSEISNQQLHWKKLFDNQWKPNFIAIGEIIDDAHPIIAIFNEISKANMDYSLYEGNPLDPIEYWVKIASSFHEWVDRLITAQGAKFWDWR